MSTPNLRFTSFNSVYDRTIIPRDEPWGDLVALFMAGHNTEVQDKMQAPIYSPAEWRKGARRTKKDVVRVAFGVLDIDKVSEDDYLSILHRLASTEYVTYSTWSHGRAAKSHRVAARIVVRLSRPVEVREWPTFWDRMNIFAGGLADPSCKDESRIYFMPACPAPDAPQAFCDHNEGQPLDVDGLLASASIILPERPGVATEVTEAHINALAARLKRSTSNAMQGVGYRLTKMLQGREYAKPGERDSVSFLMACTMVEEWPHGDPEVMAEFFRPSLLSMAERDSDCLTVEDVAEKMTRHQNNVLAEETEKKATAEEDQRRVVQGLLGEGRADYTEAELEGWAKEFGTERAGLDSLWVLQKGTAYFVFIDGTYRGPYGKEELPAVCRDLFTPIPNVTVMTESQGKLSPMGAAEIMIKYGTVLDQFEASMVIPRTQYYAAERRLVEAVCPQRDLPPVFSPVVDGWLRLIGGEQYETLLDWMACVTDLSQPCAALYFEGVPGAGKTLFAEGISRIWGTSGPTPLASAMSSFNSAIQRCPLLIADEQVPEDFMGRAQTRALRQIIQSHQIPLRRKFMPETTLNGSIRLVITANNQELLTSNEHLTRDDIRAIVERIVHVRAGEEARLYLEGLSVDDLRGLVHDDAIAKHAHWLRANRIVRPSGRFLVTGNNQALARSLTVNSGLRGSVCHWLVAYLLEPNKLESINAGTEYVRRGPEGLLVTAQGVGRYWSLYETNTMPPTVSRVSRALEGLAESVTVRQLHTLAEGGTTVANFFRIDLENLVVWAEEHGFADRDSILRLALAERKKKLTRVVRNAKGEA